MFHSKLALTLLALSPAALLSAQIDPPARVPATPTAAAESVAKNVRGATEADAVLANWLLVTNENTIALARLAKEKAQSNDVKQFAQMVLNEHTQFAKELQPFVGTTTDGKRTSKSHGTSRGTEKHLGAPADASGVRHAAVAGAFDHVALVRDLGKKCLESTTKMLDEKTAGEFDQAYMQMQVSAHVMSADMLEVFGTHASESLRPVLADCLKAVQTHLESAKSLCKKAEKAAKAEKSTKIGGDDRK